MSDQTKRETKIQGEGDKEAAREYNEATHRFVESGKVDEAARRAGDQDPAESTRTPAISTPSRRSGPHPSRAASVTPT